MGAAIFSRTKMMKRFSSMKWIATYRVWASVASRDPLTWNRPMIPLEEEGSVVKEGSGARFDSKKTMPIITAPQLQPQTIDQSNVGQAAMDLWEQIWMGWSIFAKRTSSNNASKGRPPRWELKGYFLQSSLSCTLRSYGTFGGVIIINP